MKNEDVALIQRILIGDENAFACLIGKYEKQVHAHAWRKTGDFHIAEDITQETFLQVYQKLETLEDATQFSRWLYKIVNNLCNAWFRKNRIKTESLEETDISEIETEAYSQYVATEHAQTTAEAQRDLVKKLLTKLKESDREVITLHYFEEMTSSEIGTYLGVSENTAKSRLRRARQRLKKFEFMIQETLDITVEEEQRSQHQLKGDIIMAKEVKDAPKVEVNPEEINQSLTEMRTEIAELREQIQSIVKEQNTGRSEDDMSRPPRSQRGDAFKTLSTLPEDAENHVAWGYVGVYKTASNAGKSRIAYWSDSIDIFLNKAPDADIVNLASLFTNPAIVAVLRQLVEGDKSIADLAKGSGISEDEIEEAVQTLMDATLVARTEDNLIKPQNDVISFFLNFVSMTIVHLGHIKPKN
ncbi:MAG: RNA polymerase sigma factor [Candidatus Poribacteria bacterium]|nr:RNA polymerase sigma factor [Candidatus Poribacteria bacterium]